MRTAPEPISGLVFLPKYRIRFDDGSELVVPSAEALEQRVRRGEVLPDTVIFDAGRGIWCRAGEAPLVRSIVSEIGPEPLPGWTAEPEEPRAVASQSVAPVAPAPDVPARHSKPDSDLVAGLTRELETERAPFAFHAAAAGAEALALIRRVPFTVTRRASVVAGSLVGGVGIVALGAFVLQGPEMVADDIIAPATLAAPMRQTTPPEERLEIRPSAGTVASPIAGARQPAAISDRAARSPEPAPAREVAPPRAAPQPVATPALPQLSARVANGLEIQLTTSSPLVALPAPPQPTVRALVPATEATVSTVTQPPQVLNALRVQQALEREYPIGLRALGMGGRVELSFHVNEQGGVEQFLIKESSGNPALDQAAMRVAPVFQFAPALRGRERVAAWLSRGITFGVAADAIAASSGTLGEATTPPPSQGTAAAVDQPVATQFDVAPRVSNANRVRQALEREYPIGLRAAGIGGRIEMWFYVNEEGGIEAFQIGRGSGDKDLDEAARRVARVFQFTPGSRGSEPVPGWILVGITFDAKDPSPIR